MSFMNGWKTYLVCAVAIIYAVSGILSGNLDGNTAVGIILAALGAAGLRHGITTTSQK